VAIDEKIAGLLAVADRPRAEAARTVAALKRMGIEVAMLTGDRRATAQAIASELGIDRVIAEVRPEDKAAAVEAERARGRRVAMVGDGVNDAPALARADLGIAMGSGTDIALAAADVALLGGDLSALPTALRLGRATLTNIRQNLFWAFAYNVVGIPLAAGVLLPFTGWQLDPVFASVAMSLSSVSVLLSALRLTRFERSFRRGLRRAPALAVAGLSLALGAVAADGVAQAPTEIEIVVQGGYRPDRIEVRAGAPVRLRFVRHEYSGCTREVVFPSLGIRRELPPHTPVVIDLGVLAPGEYPFECGMGMIRGVLVVSP
jgi:soluble P-type ATPase